jgi:hypothetical protein
VLSGVELHDAYQQRHETAQALLAQDPSQRLQASEVISLEFEGPGCVCHEAVPIEVRGVEVGNRGPNVSKLDVAEDPVGHLLEDPVMALFVVDDQADEVPHVLRGPRRQFGVGVEDFLFGFDVAFQMLEQGLLLGRAAHAGMRGGHRPFLPSFERPAPARGMGAP